MKKHSNLQMVPKARVVLCELCPLTSQLGNAWHPIWNNCPPILQLGQTWPWQRDLPWGWKVFSSPLSSWCFWLIQFVRVKRGKETNVLCDTVAIYSCVTGILCCRHSVLYKCRLRDHKRICALTICYIISYHLNPLIPSVHSLEKGTFKTSLKPGSSQCIRGHRNLTHTCHTKWRDFTLQHCCPASSSCLSELLQTISCLHSAPGEQ